MRTKRIVARAAAVSLAGVVVLNVAHEHDDSLPHIESEILAPSPAVASWAAGATGATGGMGAPGSVRPVGATGVRGAR